MIEGWMFLQEKSGDTRDALRRALTYQSERLFRQVRREETLVTFLLVTYATATLSELALKVPQLKEGSKLSAFLSGEGVLFLMGTVIFILGIILFTQRLRQFKLEISLLRLQFEHSGTAATKASAAEKRDKGGTPVGAPTRRSAAALRKTNLGDDG